MFIPCWSAPRACFVLGMLALGLSLTPVMATAQSQRAATPGAADTPPDLSRSQEAPPPEVRAPRAQAPAMTDRTQVALVEVERFEFRGNTRFSDDELRHYLRLFTGKRLSLHNLFEAADAVTDLYRDAGWSLATAVVPAQRIDGGTVVLEIVEGRLGKLEIEGGKRYRESMLRSRAGVEPGELVRQDELQAGMQRIADLPGLDARAVLRPGAEYGETDIVLRVQERAVEGSLFTDNYGRDNVGEFRVGATGTLNNPLRLGDRLQVVGMQSQGALLRYGSVDYSVALNRRNLRAFANYAEARFEIGSGPFSGFIDGKNRIMRAGLEQPLLLRARERADAYIAVKDVTADTDQFGISTRGTDITLLEIGGTYTRFSSSGARSSMGIDVSSNFRKQARDNPVFLSGEPGKRQRFRAALDLLHRQPIGQYALTARLDAAWSPDRLVDTELYALGGPGSVRGYPSAEARGDYGVAGSLAFSRAFRLGWAILDPRIFVDGGRAWRQDAFPGEAPVTLSSAGLGLDIFLRQYAVLRIDAARPLDSDRDQISDGRDSGRIFAALQIAF